MLEEIVNTLPAGVHYQAMDLRGDVLALRGVAASNQGISALMRNLQECPWFGAPRLLDIEDAAHRKSPEGGSAFSMTVLRLSPRAAPHSALIAVTAATPAEGG